MFKECTAPLQAELEREGRRIRLTRGNHLFHEGDMSAHLAIVVTGSLRVYKNSQNGRQITLYRVKGNEACAVNMLSVFFSIPLLASAVPEPTVDVLLFDRAVVRGWFRSKHDFRESVFGSLAKRLAKMVSLVEQVTFEDMDRRLAGFLMQRYSEKRVPRHIIAKTHGEIADELGTAREVVSRRLKEFEKKGIIAKSRGRVELLDTSLLTRMQGASANDSLGHPSSVT